MASLHQEDNQSRSRRSSEFAKQNFTSKYRLNDDDDSDGQNDGDDAVKADSGELWRAVDFGRSKGSVIQSNDFEFDRRPSAYSHNSSGNRKEKSDKKVPRTYSEKQILDSIECEEIPSDVYVNNDEAAKDNSHQIYFHDDDVTEKATKKKTNMFVNFDEPSPDSPSRPKRNQRQSSASPSIKTGTSDTDSAYSPSYQQQQKAFNEKEDREKELLRRQLEASQAQNEQLQQLMSKQKRDTEYQIEQERREKLDYRQQVEQEKLLLAQQLAEFQRESEQRLRREKEALIAATDRMEGERREMQRQMRLAEERHQAEIAAIHSTKADIQRQLDQQEKDRAALLEQVERNRQASALDSEADKQRLAEEQQLLHARVQQMEREKSDLLSSLASSEEQLRRVDAEAHQAAQREGEGYGRQLQEMEAEREQLKQHLLQSESDAQAHMQELLTQVGREKEQMEAAMKRVEEENAVLAGRLTEAATSATRDTVDAEVKQKEPVALAEQMEALRVEKVALALQLEQAAQLSAERERAEVDRVARERDELKALVERMKAEHQAAQEASAARPAGILKKRASAVVIDETHNTSVSIAPVSHSHTHSDGADDDLDEAADVILSGHGSFSSESTASAAGSKAPSVSSSKAETQNIQASNAKNRNFARKKDPKLLQKLSHQSLNDLLEEGPPIPASLSLPSAARRASAHRASVESSNSLRLNYVAGPDDDDEDEDVSHLASSMSITEDASQILQSQLLRQAAEDDKSSADPFADLPAPHAAAARGELDLLKSLARLEPDLLKSLDSKGRSPLFYAVAYNHVLVADYICQIYPELAVAVDCFGDSPLHAAASAGSEECADLLLSLAAPGVTVDANLRNKKGMTPAHMTSSAAVLEFLLAAGADFAVTDDNERSPLFVACAMDRLEAADYLVACLDVVAGPESSLLQRDKRGDTPLHAAACNGSVDCLLLLLQHAIDPRLINDKGLKAIDLAVKNKHLRCRDLLAEYHLHFCTSSSFDSVLFFAALEGHRRAKDIQSSLEGAADGEGYSIVRKPSGPALATADVMKRVRSLFSLRDEHPLRLENWGQWILFQDTINNTAYWYNQDTQQGSAGEPAEVTALKARTPVSAAASFTSQGKFLTKVSQPSLPFFLPLFLYTAILYLLFNLHTLLPSLLFVYYNMPYRKSQCVSSEWETGSCTSPPRPASPSSITTAPRSSSGTTLTHPPLQLEGERVVEGEVHGQCSVGKHLQL